ncbi:transaldolase [Changpingibacter yushuensis]|uniref:transaldolase n=1 Tax=Changpingibacter yushuensis TaxID=2758440 RepID=UPI00165E07AA|nr:transaldolase [Changpingibacter yushuensis]
MADGNGGVLASISEAGVSLWLDDLSRQRFNDGSLDELIARNEVVGVTTNPSIFDAAISNGAVYNGALVAANTADPEQAAFAVMVEDVAKACDVFAPVFEASDGRDGRVSIEVSPLLAHDTAATASQAVELWKRVNKPNAMIKIPATKAGLPAITATIARGISVNVTLIFSLERYREVIDAYMAGLELAIADNKDLSQIRSVASFFVSRVDTEVDRRLAEIGDDAAAALRSKAGLANARLAYEEFEKSIATERWQVLEAAGANVQRPLWASTGVKDPRLPGYLYVAGLVAPSVVNTVPEKTLLVTRDEGVFEGDTIHGTYGDSAQVFADVEKAGVDFEDVTRVLESEGVDKFIASWKSLLATVEKALAQ